MRDDVDSVYAFIRRGDDADPPMLVVCNFTPVPRHNYRVGVPQAGYWTELLNTDAAQYGGSNVGNYGGVEAGDIWIHGQPHCVDLLLPPLAVIVLRGA